MRIKAEIIILKEYLCDMKYNTINKDSDYKSEDELHLHADSEECQCHKCRNGETRAIFFPDIDDIVESLNDWD